MRGAVAPSPPSEGFGFRAPPVADTARKASRCRPQVRERIAEARAENGEGAKVDACIKDLSRQTEGEIHRVYAKAVGIDENKVIMIPVSLCARLYLGTSSSLAFSLPQSSPLNPERLDSSLLRGSRGSSRANAQIQPFRQILQVRTTSIKMCPHGGHTFTFVPKGQKYNPPEGRT